MAATALCRRTREKAVSEAATEVEAPAPLATLHRAEAELVEEVFTVEVEEAEATQVEGEEAVVGVATNKTVCS